MSWGIWAAPSLAAGLTVSFSPSSSITADGSSSTTVTASPTVLADVVTFSASPSGVIIGPTVDNNGTESATITSNTTAGPVTITANDSTASTSGQATLTLLPGPAANVSTPGLSPTSIVANGSAHSTATVNVTDANNNPVPGDSVTFAANPSTGVSIGTPNDHGNGTYSAQISGTVAGTPSITATDGAVTSSGATLTLTSPNSAPVNQTLPSISGSTLQGRR